MVKRCVVPGCGRYRAGSDDYAFYSLPKNETERPRWVEILKLDESRIGKHSVVCGRHFEPKYSKRRRLSGSVLPVPFMVSGEDAG